MKFAVITSVPSVPSEGDILTREQDGNLGHSFYIEPTEPGKRVHEVCVLSPVFELGEVLLLDDVYGREIDAGGRCPDKWQVVHEDFRTIEEAIARAREVLGRPETPEEAEG